MFEYRGTFQVPPHLRIALVVSRFNELITKPLLEGALDCLRSFQIEEDHLHVAWVPGAFELPLVAKRFAQSGTFDAVICLGAVIRGETDHYDYVCGPASSGIATVSLETNLPILFGVLTCETIEQALARAGSKAGNKGSETALAALEMISLLQKLPQAEERSTTEKYFNTGTQTQLAKT